MSAQEAETRGYAISTELCMAQVEGHRQDLQAALASSQAGVAELELCMRSLRAQTAAERDRASAAQCQAEAARTAQSEAQAAAAAAEERAEQLEEALARAVGESLQAQLCCEEEGRRAEKAQAAAVLLEAPKIVEGAATLLAMAQHEHKARQDQLKQRWHSGIGKRSRRSRSRRAPSLSWRWAGLQAGVVML